MNHLKVLDDASTDDHLIIEGYLALYGGDDLTGERFTKSTQFDSDYTAQDAVLIDWEHGMKPDGVKSPGADDVLGRVDWASAQSDETGLLVRRILNRRNKYVQQVIEPLTRAGLLGSSSEAVPGKVQKAKDGTIEIWPLKRDSFTVNPAEPRLLTTHQMQVIKSLADDYPALKSLLAEGAEDGAAEDIQGQDTDNSQTNEVNTMNDVNVITRDEFDKFKDEVMEAVKAASPDAKIDQIMEMLTALPAAKKAGYVAPDSEDDHADKKSFGDFLLAVKRGNAKRLASVYKTTHQKDMTEGSSVTGGVLVPEEYASELLRFTPETTPILSRVRTVPVMSDAGTYPSLDQFTAPTAGSGETAMAGQITSATTAEAATLTETQAKFKDLNWRVSKIGGYVEVSNELIADSMTSIEGLLQSLFRISIDSKLARHILRGSGVGEPLGILNAACAIGVTPANNNQFAIADGMNMIGRLKSLNENSVAWLLNRSLIPDFAAYWTVTAGESLVQPRQSLTGGILGYPVVYSEHLPLADASGAAILADLSAYLLFQRQGLTVAYSEHAAFTSDKSTWRFTGRWDGKPWLNAAITEANPGTGRTVSPFVYHND